MTEPESTPIVGTDTPFAPFERETIDHMAIVRRFAEGDTQRLADNSFVPTLQFNTDIETVRAVAFAQLEDGDSRNKVAYAARVLSAAIDDLWSITWVADTYHATQMTKTDGSKWEQGDMQHAFTNKTVDAHLLREALTYQILEGDRMTMAMVPYERDADDNITLLWDEAKCDSEGSDKVQRFSGFFPDMMREAFGQAKILSIAGALVAAEALGINMDKARLHTLCAGVKLVMDQTQIPVLIPCHSEEEKDLVEHSFSEANPFNDRKYGVFDQDDVAEIDDLEEALALPDHEKE